LSATHAITVNAGAGSDALTGGAGDDVFVAGGKTTMTGKAGANEFTFLAPGPTNKIQDFGFSGTNELVFSNAGFNLGQSGAGSMPLALPTSLFTANGTGKFTTTSQRLAYDTANGNLFASANGSGGSSQLVATLTGAPSIDAAKQLFFIS
jgi:Ca2+-binding RTX toxin-like protein